MKMYECESVVKNAGFDNELLIGLDTNNNQLWFFWSAGRFRIRMKIKNFFLDKKKFRLELG